MGYCSGMTNAQTGRGSAANIIAAVCSFFLPGLGQLAQGRLLMALFMVIMGVILWVVTFTLGGWIIHIWAAIDAALYEPKK